MRLTLANLHARGGELDEGLEDVGHRALATVGMPEQLPDFMGFPVIAGVEERDASKIDRGCLPLVV